MELSLCYYLKLLTNNMNAESKWKSENIYGALSNDPPVYTRCPTFQKYCCRLGRIFLVDLRTQGNRNPLAHWLSASRPASGSCRRCYLPRTSGKGNQRGRGWTLYRSKLRGPSRSMKLASWSPNSAEFLRSCKRKSASRADGLTYQMLSKLDEVVFEEAPGAYIHS